MNRQTLQDLLAAVADLYVRAIPSLTDEQLADRVVALEERESGGSWDAARRMERVRELLARARARRDAGGKP